MGLEELRLGCAIKQKKGLHFILASVVSWCAILIIHLSKLPISTKNLFTFYATAPVVPLAFFISKIIKVDFQNKENPLNKLGVLFSVNQMLYLLIAMWVYPNIPQKMLMVIAIIFGAHLLPYSWLYKSKSYGVLSFIIPILSLVVGINFKPYIIALMMILIEILFSVSLIIENKSLSKG
ncbi:DUF7010 family protein [Clostridium rectalis]|uniref:DUF7010 family protein n=1 Tax=Clostridium rectalis TaxID=2040295 RepID=UPI000F641F23|nr:hypothetical protein [Clostridium rectalis]